MSVPIRTTPWSRRWAGSPSRRRWPARGPLALLLVTALLGAGSPPAAGQPALAPGDPVTLNFQDADLDVFLDAFAQALGVSYVVAPEVRRKVTVQGRAPRRNLLDMFLAVLEVHGLTAVRSGDLYKIIRIPSAQSQGLPVVVGTEPDPTRRSEEMVTQVVPLRYGSVADVARVLQSLVGREGILTLHRETNLLVISDSVEKIRRYLAIVRMLDVPTAQEQVQVLPLRFADAATLAPLVSQLVGGAPGAPPARPLPAMPGRPGEPVEAAPALADLREAAGGRTVVLADPRTNTLLAVGSPAALERVRTLVARLDTEAPPTRGVFVYQVEHLRAKELAASLTGLFRRRTGPEAPPPRPPAPPPVGGPPGARVAPPPPGDDDLAGEDLRVVPDEASNTLLITATPPAWAALQPILQRLDRMPRRILIEILVAEFFLDDSTALGIEWALRSDRGLRIGGERLSVGSGLDTGVPGIQPLPPAFFFILQNKDLLSLLQAFSQANRLNVLSSPHVLTSENKRAQIHVGRSVPILTSQQQPAVGVAGQAQPTSVITTTVEYRDVGVILTVTPRVADNRFVSLEVRQEVSDVVPANQVQPNTPPSPSFTKRVAETSVVVGELETLVLGGLIEERKVLVREGIPFLSRIPILGYLFGATREALVKTELMILVTPRLVLDPGESRLLYEELKRRSPELKREIEGPPPNPQLPTPPPPPPRPAPPHRPHAAAPPHEPGPELHPRDLLPVAASGGSRKTPSIPPGGGGGEAAARRGPTPPARTG
jgi:general secretion pathway protein D